MNSEATHLLLFRTRINEWVGGWIVSPVLIELSCMSFKRTKPSYNVSRREKHHSPIVVVIMTIKMVIRRVTVTADVCVSVALH